MNFVKNNIDKILLFSFILLYIIYFSYFTILRHNGLYTQYFDLGIMDQTVFNTFKGRILEMTNTHGIENIKRMAIHNDIFLALLAPFYAIYKGPQTLLVIQSIIIALGAIPLYLLSKKVLKSKIFSVVLSFSYLIFSPLERANIFDFHAVCLSITFILFMFYFSYIKKYFLSFVFFILVIITKEEVALATCFFGMYLFFKNTLSWKDKKLRFSFSLKSSIIKFALLVILISIIWFVLSIWVIMPYFRKGQHFAISYYSGFGDSAGNIISGIISNPIKTISIFFQKQSLMYFFFFIAPLFFFPIFAPEILILSLPEFAINLLSSNQYMRSFYLQYVSVIIPFVFIATIFGVKRVLNKVKFINIKIISFLILISTLLFAYLFGPLPFSRKKDIHPFMFPRKESEKVLEWEKKLKDESLIISATDFIAPHFTNRKTFYIFSDRYKLADYVLVRTDRINKHYQKDALIKAYTELKDNNKFKLIDKYDNFEVYMKVKH